MHLVEIVGQIPEAGVEPQDLADQVDEVEVEELMLQDDGGGETRGAEVALLPVGRQEEIGLSGDQQGFDESLGFGAVSVADGELRDPLERVMGGCDTEREAEHFFGNIAVDGGWKITKKKKPAENCLGLCNRVSRNLLILTFRYLPIS